MPIVLRSCCINRKQTGYCLHSSPPRFTVAKSDCAANWHGARILTILMQPTVQRPSTQTRRIGPVALQNRDLQSCFYLQTKQNMGLLLWCFAQLTFAQQTCWLRRKHHSRWLPLMASGSAATPLREEREYGLGSTLVQGLRNLVCLTGLAAVAQCSE